ncbi:5-formyltetrahydrofolate cyclo-ligase [Labrys monachus]|uniref:5-formyltetrahydrofolate cyclo-ligase n=1 Tax=Labrys monachus TaxID=217067 RepID=A0ABU0F8T4_9HYPH|nr:5-formyltetrahydrofolate cyclo-ligase [Labrys monachus]MDQ0390856.1 5-formyltetrahydrofolate cyclo-ligase [Labrys monachus]
MASTDQKTELRRKAMAARAELRGPARHEATAKAAARAFERLSGTTGIVGLYEAFRDEIHPGEVARRLAAGGRRLALPATPKFGQPLVFRAWAPGDPLVQGRMNIPEPSPDAPEVYPQVLLVPPVAFDRRGYRIGYGAGFYDRTIPMLRARHPVFALGYAFACQETEDLPAEHHDVPLDAIATEAEIIAVAGA